MDLLIPIIRFPVGLLTISFVFCFLIVVFLFEPAIGILLLPFAALLMDRDEI